MSEGEDMSELKIGGLSQNRFAIIDDEDFEELSKYKWYFHDGYVERKEKDPSGKRRHIKMHVQILGKKSGLEIDHINRNTMDNRRTNLRHVTTSQNQQNSVSRIGTSQYKGVSRRRNERKWRSQIHDDGKDICLGMFENEIDAAVAYNEAAKKLFGEYACLNVIQEGN